MTEEQKDRLSIYREFGDNAQKAYNFIFKTTQCNNDLHSIKDGVYIIYKDGRYELFNGENKKDNVSKIGLVLGEKKICIGLKDKYRIGIKDNYRSLINNDNYEKYSNYKYYENPLGALFDWDGEENTKHIKLAGTDISLDEGEFIPSAGQIYFIYMFLKSVNEALQYVGGEKLLGKYWTSTKCSNNMAWNIHFIDGHLNGFHVWYPCCYVRAVSKFPHK